MTLTNQKLSQNERIIEILERDGQIDNFSCIHNRISLRLGARVHELRALGFSIRTEKLSDKNTVYHLVERPKPQQHSLYGSTDKTSV